MDDCINIGIINNITATECLEKEKKKNHIQNYKEGFPIQLSFPTRM